MCRNLFYSLVLVRDHNNSLHKKNWLIWIMLCMSVWMLKSSGMAIQNRAALSSLAVRTYDGEPLIFSQQMIGSSNILAMFSEMSLEQEVMLLPAFINHHTLLTLMALMRMQESDVPLEQQIAHKIQAKTEIELLVMVNKLLKASIFLDIPRIHKALATLIAVHFPTALPDYFTQDEHQHIMDTIFEKIRQSPVLHAVLVYTDLAMHPRGTHRPASRLKDVTQWSFADQKDILCQIRSFLTMADKAPFFFERHHTISYANPFDIDASLGVINRLTKILGLSLWYTIRALLRSLNVSESELLGPIETDFVVIEGWLKQEAHVPLLRRITSLSKTHSNFLMIPSIIGYLPALQSLDLSYNLLTHIPESVYHLTQLKRLTVQHNCFTMLSDKVGNLTALISADFTNNSLQVLPSTIGQLSNLTSLMLRNNRLTALPQTIQLLEKSLKEISLGGNECTDETIEHVQLLIPLTRISMAAF